MYEIAGCKDPENPSVAVTFYTSDPGKALITGKCVDVYDDGVSETWLGLALEGHRDEIVLRALVERPDLEVTDEHVDRLRAAIPGEPLQLGTQEQFVYNADFHSIVIEACGNTLLTIAAQPIFGVLQTHLARSRLGRKFHIAVNEHHREIADAIDAGNERAAREQMYEHLEFLRPYYEQAWRDVRASG